MDFFKSGCGCASSKIVAGQRNVIRQGTTREVELLEDTLATEMSSISVQERAKAMDDVHCVGEGLEENEEMRRRLLAEFDQIVKATKNRYYDLAASRNRGFVEDETFRLQFIRARLYDVKKAVRQMMNFLHFKATYFGEENVAREVELSDLSQEDVSLLRSGLYVVPNHRDRAGRLVLYILNHLLSGCTTEALIRVNFFFFCNLLASLPDVQMKGISAIYYDTSKPGDEFVNPGFQSQLQTMTVANSIPFRCTSLHFCLKPTNGNLVLNNAVIRVFLNSLLQSTLVRTRLHIGSDMEIQYMLQSHGISQSTCPVDSSGDIRQKILDTWYENHLDYMKSTGLCVGKLVGSLPSANRAWGSMERGDILNSYAVVNVRESDVLLGRGRFFQDHPGNVRFRNALEDYRDAYDTARRNQKRRIVIELRQMLAAEGIRFLKQLDGTNWVESDAKAVEDKIGQLFRTARKKKDAVTEADIA